MNTSTFTHIFKDFAGNVDISPQTFIQMVLNSWIIDARAGGLVLGRSHAEGNIYMLQFNGDNDFAFPGHMEGSEYIINSEAYKAKTKRVKEINSFCSHYDPITKLDITKTTKILNTHASPADKLLWVENESFYIINKCATAKYLEELEYINSKYNGYKECNLHHLAPKTP